MGEPSCRTGAADLATQHCHGAAKRQVDGFGDQAQVEPEALVALIDEIQLRLARDTAAAIGGFGFGGGAAEGKDALLMGVKTKCRKAGDSGA